MISNVTRLVIFVRPNQVRFGGTALDVVASEPLPNDSPLVGRDNVILTPHNAFYSVEAVEELQSKCASDVARVLSGEKAVYPVSA
jgi:D-3-phosphoglycerate dehydrogenase